MKLFANGCSFTWGGGILEKEKNLSNTLSPAILRRKEYTEFREKSVWPWHLHQLLKTEECVNLAMGCGSNSRIVRTTLDFFVEKINKQENVSDWLAVIQWTEPSRYEVYDERNGQFNLIKTDVVLPEVSNDRFEYLQKRFLEDDKTFNAEWFTLLVCLSSFFEKHNIQYMFSLMMPMYNLNNYCINNMNWLDSTIESSVLIDTEKFRYDSFHPNLDGHKYIANRIYNRIKEI